jgi:predicted permease
LTNLKNIDPGFDAKNVLLFRIDPALAGLDNIQIQNLYRELQSKFAALPGVLSVGYSSSALLTGGLSNGKIAIDGQPDPPQLYDVDQLSIGPNFFETMRIPLLAGRVFNSAELAANPEAAKVPSRDAAKSSPSSPPSPMPVLINEAFARRYYHNRDPLGMRLSRGDRSSSTGGYFDGKQRSRAWQVIGIVADTKYSELRREIRPTVYLPKSGGGASFEVRTAMDPNLIVPAIRSIVAGASPDVPLTSVATESQAIAHGVVQERLIARLSGFFGLLALLLASVGVYGLLSYDVTRRTREFGIRTALGADAKAVLGLVIRRGVILSVAGTAIGVVAAATTTRYLESLLYGVHAGDAPTLAAVATLLTLVILAACYIPARRATRADPMIALRHE